MSTDNSTDNIRTIDAEEAFDLLQQVVAEKGEDYVYHAPTEGSQSGTCLYVNPTDVTHRCIIGEVLVGRLGVPTDVFLDECPFLGERPFNGTGIVSLNAKPSFYKASGIKFTPEAASILNEAQQVQDTGRSWGEALKAARYRFEAHKRLKAHEEAQL